MSSNLFNIQGYKLFRFDRLSHAGGVAIYVRFNISVKFISKSPVNNLIEYLFLELSSGASKLLLGSVYRPYRSVDISEFIEYLHDISLGFNNIIIVDDFNSNRFEEYYLSSNMSLKGFYYFFNIT